MRIIAGEFRSRRLKAVPGRQVRPTSDRLRETLFNVLGARVRGAVFVDAYAGSGAIGLEAISRGASLAVFIEASRAALSTLRANIAALDVHERVQVIEGKVDACLTCLGVNPDIIFIDPPYSDVQEYDKCFEIISLCRYPALVVAEHSRKGALPPCSLRRIRLLQQGDSALSFYTLE
jgi:16S rRNA (guanine(966)-N(2))-methyltransferase RsmD